MKKVTLLLCVLLASCASSKRIKKKKTYVSDLTSKYRLYSVKGNSYFYFMMDSSGGPHLVKTHHLNSEKVLWIEKLGKVN